VPDKRLWYLRVRALAASGQWSALKQLSVERKSPIGYRPFAAAALEHKQPRFEVEHYAERITQTDERCVMFTVYYIPHLLLVLCRDTIAQAHGASSGVRCQANTHAERTRNAIAGQFA
jgi:Vps16, C-terminal region